MSRSFKKTWRADRWVRPYLKQYRGILIAAVVLGVVAYLFAAGLMFTSGYMISLAATIPFTVLALHIPSIFVRIFGIGKPLLQYVERLSSHDWVLRMTSNLRERLYVRAERMRRSQLGQMLGLFASDIEHVQDFYLRTVIPLTIAMIVYTLIVIAIGVFSPAMGLLLLVLIGFVAVVMPLWSVAVNGARVARRAALVSSLYDRLTDDVIGIRDWRLSGKRDEFVMHALQMFDARRAVSAEMSRFERRCALLRQLISAVVVCAMVVWAAFAFGAAAPDGFVSTGVAAALGAFAVHDSVPYGLNWVAAFVLCVFPLMEVFAPASEAALGFALHEPAIRDLNVLDAAEARVDVDVSGSMERDAIRFSGVGFWYEKDNVVLRDVDIAIPKGQHVAVIGKSGAGKTTLLELARGGIAACEGEVCVDGMIGIIEQEPYIFRKSLRENMLLARTTASDEQIVDALERVGLGDVLDRLPQGLDTVLAEGGITLSGGEGHRLALARILLAQCDVVLLDEPYRGLDVVTERVVADALFDAFADKTVVMVTHHLQGIERFDRVIMIGEGGIEADGAPAALERENTHFRALLTFERGI